MPLVVLLRLLDQLGLVTREVGGVGLEVMCTPGTLAGLRTGQEATLPTSMVVREDSLTLFGFADEDEKQTFELVQTASGVGPKLAQAMVACLAPDDLRRAVGSDDVKTLTRVPGIGQKGAQRIILELKDRLGAPTVGGAPASGGPADAQGAGGFAHSAPPLRRDWDRAATGIGSSVDYDVRRISMDLEPDPVTTITIHYDFFHRRHPDDRPPFSPEPRRDDGPFCPEP